jgi:hypothetical protein
MKPPLAVSVVLLFALAAPSRGSDRGLWRGGERTRTADFYVANASGATSSSRAFSYFACSDVVSCCPFVTVANPVQPWLVVRPWYRPCGPLALRPPGVVAMAVLALNAALLVLDDDLGLLPTGLLAGSSDRVALPVHHPGGPLGPALLNGPPVIRAGLD